MNISRLLFITIILLLNKNATAQKDKVKLIEWKKIGLLPETNGHPLGFAGAVAGVSNNMFIVGGGANFPDTMPWLGGKKKYYDDLYVYQKNDNDSLVLFRSFKLPFPLGYAACVSSTKGIIFVGGENANGISDKVLLLQWNVATQDINTMYLPDLPYPLTGAGALVHDGILYVAGGDMGAETSKHFLSLNLNSANAEWKELAALQQPTSHAVFATVSDEGDDLLYLVGGRKKNPEAPSTLYKEVFAYDLKKDKWIKKHALPHVLSAGTGVAVGNKIILFGGDTGETFHKTEELIFAIAKEKNEDRKKQLTLEKIKVQSGHPGFCGTEWMYDSSTNRWSQAGCIPFDVPVTTVAVPWNHEVIIAGGEIRAGVRTPQILSAKINM